MAGILRQPLFAGGPTGLTDIEENFRRTRFIPGLFYLLRQRGADMIVDRRVKSAAPLVVGEPQLAGVALTARELYGDRSGLAAPRPAPVNTREPLRLDRTALPANLKQQPASASDTSFGARILLIDDDFTVSDPFFDTGVEEQRCITVAQLFPGDIVTYLRHDTKRRAYEVTSAPMVLGGTTEMLYQFTLGPATV